jgi:2-succinyl-6-hydroxy-2,4-cyclohexadiene-1-carboxylate synthase
MALNLHTVRSGASPSYFFVHGLFGSAGDWRDVIAELPPERGVLTLNLPGHGGAEPIDSRIATFDQYLDHLARDFQAAIREPVVGVGYSLGGRILLGLWQRIPEMFSALCLVSTFPGFESEEERRQRLRVDGEWIEKLARIPGDEFFSEWYDQPLFARSEWSPDVEGRILTSRAGLRATDLAGIFGVTSAASMPSFWGDLASTSIPVHYVVGSRDVKYLRIAERLAGCNPVISASVIEGAGHLVLLEKPHELARSMYDFVKVGRGFFSP